MSGIVAVEPSMRGIFSAVNLKPFTVGDGGAVVSGDGLQAAIITLRRTMPIIAMYFFILMSPQSLR
jgi:hypothetical protein